jgi:hypothetical protein
VEIIYLGRAKAKRRMSVTEMQKEAAAPAQAQEPEQTVNGGGQTKSLRIGFYWQK